MAKVTRSTDGATPKKRTRKATSEAVNSTEVVAKSIGTQEIQSAPSIEEKIRARAYELFLQRRGRGGSPEQDWLQAVAEVRGSSIA